jgi:hypothetical protein
MVVSITASTVADVPEAESYSVMLLAAGPAVFTQTWTSKPAPEVFRRFEVVPAVLMCEWLLYSNVLVPEMGCPIACPEQRRRRAAARPPPSFRIKVR